MAQSEQNKIAAGIGVASIKRTRIKIHSSALKRKYLGWQHSASMFSLYTSFFVFLSMLFFSDDEKDYGF